MPQFNIGDLVFVSGRAVPTPLPGVISATTTHLKRKHGLIYIVDITDGKDRPAYYCELQELSVRPGPPTDRDRAVRLIR